MSKQLRRRLGSLRIIAVFGGIYLVSQIIIACILHSVGAKEVLELQTSLSSSFVRDTLDAWKASGLISTYQRHYFLDFFHPVWYSIFLMAVLSRLFVKYEISQRYDIILFFPPIAGFCDLFENISHVFFIFNANTITPVWVGLSGTAAMVKWGLAAASIIIIVVVSGRGRIASG